MEAPNPDESSALNINLNDDAMNEEVTVTLTVGQLMIVKEFLGEHMHPKGYEMISFAYDLFSRLSAALEVTEWPATSKIERSEPIASTRMGSIKREDKE
jgi:hypothetical protein